MCNSSCKAVNLETNTRCRFAPGTQRQSSGQCTKFTIYVPYVLNVLTLKLEETGDWNSATAASEGTLQGKQIWKMHVKQRSKKNLVP